MPSDIPPGLRQLISQARTKWANTGAERPPFAESPRPDQESVWDYPRPPVVVGDLRTVVVGDPADPVASTTSALRVLETASPPTFYIPAADIDFEKVAVVAGSSLCEWKGSARYWALTDDTTATVGWDYPDPFPEFEILRGHLAFYPGRVHCVVDGEVVRPQAGGFYGGWVTNEIVGPHKGEPGTQGW